jgi:sporulation protein YlmC with PRC-barrel domain
MTQSIRNLRGDQVLARDGRIGLVHDVYFDDEDWAVRYLVVDTGEWLPAKRVLISPASVEPGLSSGGNIRLAVMREQVESAPPAEATLTGEGEAKPEGGDPHLRSGTEVIGYGIEARDGAIGEVQDFVVDEDTWAIRDVVVDTMRWWPGGHVRVHPEYVERIDWNERKVHLRLTREQVKLSGAASARR